LPVTYDGAQNLHHEIPPGNPISRTRREFIRESHSSNKRCASIHEQQLAMIAQQVVQPAGEPHGVEEAQIHAGLYQTVAISRDQAERAESVEQHANADTPLRGSRERIDEATCQNTGFDEVHFEEHVLPGRLDHLQHAGKDLLRLPHEVEAVSGAPWPSHRCNFASDERVGAPDRRHDERTMTEPSPFRQLQSILRRPRRPGRRGLAQAALIPLILALGSPIEASADVIAALNVVRFQGCAGNPGVRRALRENRRLDEVARQLSRGNELRSAERSAGYHAVSSASVQVSGAPDSGDVVRVIARQFCSQTTNPAFQEVGTYRHGASVWIALAEPFTPPSLRDEPAIGRRVLELTNEARSHPRRCGYETFAAAQPLMPNMDLERAAAGHANDMAAHSYMDHTGRDGSSPADRVTRTGYKWKMVGENLASGVMSADEVVSGWIHSPHHCANLMEPRFTQMGVAFAVNPSTDAGVYWTQVFGTPATSAAKTAARK